MSIITLENQTVPDSPSTGRTRIFVDPADGILKYVDENGFVKATDPAEGTTTAITINPDLANIAQYLNGSVYELPANQYIIQGFCDFGTNTIEMVDDLGFYRISSTNFGTMSYSGAGPFIKNASGATGNLLDIRHFIVTTPNATAISMTNGNSFICDLVAFVLCARPFEMDTVAFCTLEALPIVSCTNGALVKDADTISARLFQYNDGPGLGGVGLTVQGAVSGRFFMNACDARPSAGESYLDIQASYAGDVDITGGVLSTGGGDFFKAGTRDETDIDISVQNVKNVMDSTTECGAYIAEADTTETTISAVDTITVIAGTWTIDSFERINATAAGLFTYTGKEDVILNIALKMQINPASGSNRTYWAYLRKNGPVSGGGELILLSRDVVRADAGNPAKMVLLTTTAFSTGDYFEVVIENKTNDVNVTCEANSLVIGKV